jgi:putative acetyltransferase
MGRDVAEFAIAAEDPRASDNAALIAALDAAMFALYPPESCHVLSPEQLVGKDAVFLSARVSGVAVGCVALVPDGPDTGEVKRVWTTPAARGTGVARALLGELIARAQAQGLRALRLETGPRQPQALALVRRFGFAERGRFGSYTDDPNLIFMEKVLAAESTA